jgi:hypothetical protein
MRVLPRQGAQAKNTSAARPAAIQEGETVMSHVDELACQVDEARAEWERLNEAEARACKRLRAALKAYTEAGTASNAAWQRLSAAHDAYMAALKMPA